METQGLSLPRRKGIERVERDCLERYGADAALGLGALDPSVAERTPSVEDTGVSVDIALLERDPLPRTQAGRCPEHHEGTLTVAEPGGDLGELRP
jgi:hypothetical protein